MFGCCKYPQEVFQKDGESPPDLEKIRARYPEVVSLIEREVTEPNPHTKWFMVHLDGTEKALCTCPCHWANGIGVLC